MEFYIGVAGKFAARTNLNIEALHEDEDGEQIFQGNCYREYYQREHKPGKRLFDLWRESGWAGLVRDEPFVAGFKAQIRPALLECRRVVDDLRVECVDLLDEPAGVFTVCDRGLAKTALQFQCFIGWVARYPFFSRMHGIGYPLPVGSEPGLELMRRHVREMGGPHVSVQPAFLSFAGRALVSMTSAGKILGILPVGKRVKPDNIIPILVQIEAFLRCLRRSSLG